MGPLCPWPECHLPPLWAAVVSLHGGYDAICMLLLRKGAAMDVTDDGGVTPLMLAASGGRGLHSFTFQLNLSRFGHTSPCPPV